MSKNLSVTILVIGMIIMGGSALFTAVSAFDVMTSIGEKSLMYGYTMEGTTAIMFTFLSGFCALSAWLFLQGIKSWTKPEKDNSKLN